ncbi:MAG: metal ABC transporter permease [Clostridia bacterium]|jgi:ABC-type Mn2+/Zn2+ transport system permease subunit|nr:metal ABC transporter permease [Clostridia bacterium]
MIDIIQEMLSFSFINRAMIVGTLVSLCAALLGVSLVLKRYANIGDGLSHVGFGITTVAAAFGLTPLPIALPGVVIVAIILLKIGNNRKIKSDSAIALISSTALAIGVAVTSVTTGLNTDVCNFMFGSILAMSISDVVLSIIMSIIVLTLFIIYYRKLFVVTFDEDFSKAIGLNVKRYTNLIAILTAVVIVVGMRMMGTLLISSIIIFPALTAMRICKSFKSVVLCSGIISIVSFLVGLFLSYVYNISTGATIVIVNLILFIIFLILEKIIKE